MSFCFFYYYYFDGHLEKNSELKLDLRFKDVIGTCDSKIKYFLVFHQENIFIFRFNQTFCDFSPPEVSIFTVMAFTA